MKGIAYLQEQGMVGKSTDDVAEFFHSEERLDKVSQFACSDIVIVNLGVIVQQIWCVLFPIMDPILDCITSVGQNLWW